METMYHSGEIVMQEQAGEKTIGERNGRVIVNKIIPGAINFIEKQVFFVVSSKDPAGQIWVSALAGNDGYIRVKDEHTLEIYRDRLYSNPLDRFWENIETHHRVGLLFIDPATRRRYRINGVLNLTAEKMVIDVEQAYPNCPKYIQQRHVTRSDKPSYTTEITSGDALPHHLWDMITQADTFFVGSSDLQGNMDASHRGGPPGFVHRADENTLWIPDYPGNSMFNTLGNFVVNPNGGLLFVDFEKQLNLQLSGRVQIEPGPPPNPLNTGGTNRYWKFSINTWTLMQNLKGFEWNFMAYSPFNPS